MPSPEQLPRVGTVTSSRKQAEGAVLVSSLIVVSLWGYRKLIEPVSGPAPGASKTEPTIAKLIGAEPKPAGTAQFAVAFGFVFFTLSVTAMAAPELATAFAILVAVGYTLSNGASVFTDITNQVSEKTAQPAAKPTAKPAGVPAFIPFDPAHGPQPAK